MREGNSAPSDACCYRTPTSHGQRTGELAIGSAQFEALTTELGIFPQLRCW
jgi:hypothetical protein